VIGLERRRRDLVRALSGTNVWQTLYLAVIFVGGVLVLATSIGELNATDFGLRHMCLSVPPVDRGTFAGVLVPYADRAFRFPRASSG
jgi:hypothetical protein